MSILKEYRAVREVVRPLMIADQVSGVHYNELVEIKLHNSETRQGQVLEVQEGKAMVQLFEGSNGINLGEAKVRFIGHPLGLPVPEDMVRHILNGIGKPIDGGPDLILEKYLDTDGRAINPAVRGYPDEFIQTRILTIDHLNTLVRRQELSVSSGPGLSYNELAAQTAYQATVLNSDENFAVVFVTMGITLEGAEFFMSDLHQTGTIDRSVLFIDLANDPTIERITTPCTTLTTVEYLAYEGDMHMSIIITDMTNYCEALREVSAVRREVSGRRGYPGYLYINLPTSYERAGRSVGKKDSITQIPILTMPEDDIMHPTPDLTGYIAEGQITLSHELYNSNCHPPINVLPSLSRLKDRGSGEGETRGDHVVTVNQLFTACIQGKQAAELAVVLGKSVLSGIDKLYVELIKRFEEEYTNQGLQTNRSIEETLDLGWELLSVLPHTELKRIKDDMLDQYLPQTKTDDK